jgi:hypothetical protein
LQSFPAGRTPSFASRPRNSWTYRPASPSWRHCRIWFSVHQPASCRRTHPDAGGGSARAVRSDRYQARPTDGGLRGRLPGRPDGLVRPNSPAHSAAKLDPSRTPSTNLGLTISENVSCQSISLNQITPPSQRLGGVAIFALMFGTDVWKHCGSKRERNRRQNNGLVRRDRHGNVSASAPVGERGSSNIKCPMPVPAAPWRTAGHATS